MTAVRLSCGCANDRSSYRRCPKCGYTRCGTCPPHQSCQPARIGASTRARAARPAPVILPGPIPTGEPTFEPHRPACRRCERELAACVCYDEPALEAS
jgi:hypothetical protein